MASHLPRRWRDQALQLGAVAGLVAGLSPAQASDAELQRALRQAGCGSPAIRQVLQRSDLTVFEANCFRSSHRILTVTCTRARCRVEEESPPSAEERR